MSLAVKRIGHATLQTPELDRMTEYYANMLGLYVAERESGRSFLSTASGQLAVVLEKGDTPRCSGISFQVDPKGDLGDMAKRLATAGIKAERRSDSAPGIGDVLSFTDPNGSRLDVFAQSSFLTPDRTPKPFVPLKFGHLAFKTSELENALRFYGEVLSFRVSDWRGDFFVWMRCGPDHHTVNFVKGDRIKMHHLAFEVKDQAEILRICDFLGRNKIKIIYGPGRHVIGDNVFIYHRDPDGHIVEFYTELARIDSEELGYFNPRPWRDDLPYEPKTWGTDTLGNLWGPPAPAGFGD